MKAKKMLAAVMMTVAIIGGSVLSAHAQGNSNCPQQGKNACCQQQKAGCHVPDLTDDQQKKIETLKTGLMKDKLQLQNQIDEKKAHLKTLSMAEQVDMVAVNKTIDEMYALKAQWAKRREAHIQDVRKILTDDQRLWFDSRHAQKGECGQGHMGQKNGNGQGAGCQGQGHGQGQGAGAGCQGQGAGAGCQGQGAGAGCQGQGHGQGAGTGCQGQGQGQGHGQGCQQQKSSDDKK